ncbi:hypothetical protein ACQP2P_23735 [Dactylosporangium sp. CA-139114]|uniref:hypothetical protein n=1 Tax=Dactylosporangium sp. CA-139114 TaxID=3239931 RepID=UPI003D97C1F0
MAPTRPAHSGGRLDGLLIAWIVGCEIAFRVLLAAGLACRFGKALVAGVVAVVLPQVARWWIGDRRRTEALRGMAQFVAFALVVWLLGRPVWVSVVQLLTAHINGRKQNTSKSKRR